VEKGIKQIFIIILSIIFFLFNYSCVKASISFTISNPVVNADDEIEVDATISGLIASSCSTSGCYLQAELQSAGGYFGYTYNSSSEYVDYFKSPTSTDEIKSKLFNFLPISGTWSGKLKAKNNFVSSNYYGPGDYLLIFRRFSGNSTNSLGDSNGLNVSLKASLPIPVSTITPEVSATPTPTASPLVLKTAQPTMTPTIKPTPTKTPTSTIKSTSIPISSPSATVTESVLGTETTFQDLGSIPSPTIPPEEKTSKFPLLAICCIFAGVCFIGFSIFSLIKKTKKSYNGESEKEDSQIH
jgi:hypothetical protein